MSILSIAVIVVLAAVAVVLGIAAGKPNSFTVRRDAEIAAPPETIFALLEDFHRWAAWSPYEDIDPDMKKTFEGADKGVGAVYGWDGNQKAGAGRMRITQAEAPARLALDLAMTRPFAARNQVEFLLTPVEGATRTAWVMTGPAPFMSKVMGVFVDMDQLIGRDFDKGLARLKGQAEAA